MLSMETQMSYAYDGDGIFERLELLFLLESIRMLMS